MSERFCLDCGDILRGRSDKKFCSDSCRNNYNNNLNKDITSFVRNVHAVLRRNRKILADLHQSGKYKFHIDVLDLAGFSFNFITQLVESDDGTICRFCFEFGYRELPNNYVELIKSNTVGEA